MASNEWDSIGTPVSSSDDWSAVGTPVGDSNKKQNKGIMSDIGDTLVSGAKSAGRAILSTVDAYTNDEKGLVEKAAQQSAAEQDKPEALRGFNQAVQDRVKPLGEDAGIVDSVKAIGGAVIDQPKGAGLAIVEQIPNAAPALAGGFAGMKGGAMLGAPFGPVGAAVGGVVGGVSGMFLGNAAIETGYKGINAAQDGAVSNEEMADVRREGAGKAGVITGVDALTLGLSKAVTNITARAVEKATRNTLIKAGVDVADEAAVLAARQSPEISAAVRAAQESAFGAANTIGKRAAAVGAALGLETVGEGLGEYLGELAATGKANIADAVLESMLSLGQSGAQVAWGAARNKKEEKKGIWDAAEAPEVQPKRNVTVFNDWVPIRQQRIDEMMGIGVEGMSESERKQYESDLVAAFLEPVGVTQDANGLEVPFTMADYLNSQVRAEEAARARPMKQGANQSAESRLQQIADEEATIQPDITPIAAPSIPVVGPISAAANAAVSMGAARIPSPASGIMSGVVANEQNPQSVAANSATQQTMPKEKQGAHFESKAFADALQDISLPQGLSVSAERNSYDGGFTGRLNIMQGQTKVGHVDFNFNHETGEVTINKSELTESLRGKGVAKAVYSQINQTLRTNGLPVLGSDPKNMTQHAVNLWKSLVRDGVASERTDGRNGYRFNDGHQSETAKAVDVAPTNEGDTKQAPEPKADAATESKQAKAAEQYAADTKKQEEAKPSPRQRGEDDFSAGRERIIPDDLRGTDAIAYNQGYAEAKLEAELSGRNAAKENESDEESGAGNISATSSISPSDKAIYGMAAEGKSASEILKFIASASRSPFNRQVAKLLLKTGIYPNVTVGDGKNWKMNAGEGNKYAAGYNPKTNTIALFRPAAAERNVLHEMIHAATLNALEKNGLSSGKMKALYKHVKKTGKLKGMYGMSDIDEFVAEAFTNPKFQDRLKSVSAPAGGNKLATAWDWFVRVVRGIIGLKQGQDNALSQALDIGVGVMRENMALKEAPKNYNVRGMADKDTVAGTQAPTSAGDGSTGSAKSPHVAAAEQMLSLMDDPVYTYGLRVLPDDFTEQVTVGESLPSSFVWEDGEITDEEIDGVSTAGIRRQDIDSVLAAMKNLGVTGKNGPNGYYFGSRVVLVRGDSNGSGQDVGETIIRDPEVLGEWKKTTNGLSEVMPNEPSTSAGSDDIRYNVADEGWSVSEQAREMVMRLAGRPMLDPADPFAAENARLREQDQSLWSKAKKQLRRYLAPGGLLPQSVFAEKIKRDSEFQAVEFDVRHLIGGLERAVKEDFGADFDKLTKDQMRPITEALAGNVPASLPESTKTAAIAMRQYIDGMSTEYLKIIQEKIDAKMLKAIESGNDADKAQAINEIELFEKIKGNIGRYVHRSYQAFDDPKWFEKVPASVLNASRLYLKQGYMEAGETDAKAAQLAEVTLHEILKNGTAYDSMESFIAESKLGAKDLSVLMRRKEVPPQIRALLGEYPDARLNFTKSATKMGRLIWNTRFLDRIRDIGMGAFFFEGKDRPANATTQIAADGSEVYAPLNGLWTFPETAQAFKDALGKEQMSDLYRAIVRANGIVKYGKAQPLDAVVYTPSGPSRMGDLRVGDMVCGINGSTSIEGIYPQGEMGVFRLTFSDGSSTEATGEHLWEVVGTNGMAQKYNGVFTTKEIASWSADALRYASIPLGVAEFDERAVPLDPYLVGAIIGDGSVMGSTVRLSTSDDEMVSLIRDRLPQGHKIERPKSWAACDYCITAATRSDSMRYGNEIMHGIESLGLRGKRSNEKFIPEIYRYNSASVRMDVMRGLLDTDGWVVRDGQPAFCTSSKQLATDFREVAESLGATVLWSEKTPKCNGKEGMLCYMLKLRVPNAPDWFRLGRKKDKATAKKKPVRRMFKSIEHVGTKPCQCIMVNDARHLYLTDRFIVTHNTVLSPTTAMRNWQSAMFFSLANGHFDLTQMKKSISAFREQVSQKATGSDLAYLRHLKQLGVVYDTPYAGEMAKLMQDARMEELLSTDKGDALRWFRKANQLAQGFYAFGDDFWKIIGFENEKAGLMKAGLTLQEAEVEAAKRIRDTYPTYSMVGRGIQWLSRFPLAGTFVSFPAEIIRTSGNMLRTVASDLKSDNPKLRELGMRRASGMALVSAAFWSLAAISKAMAGVGDDEEEAIRDLAPEWQKNSTFLYVGRDEKGNLRYFDMSFLDPYGYFKRPITAMMRNQPWEESLASGLRGMLEPFLGTDIAAGAIFEAVANQKDSGGKVYKEKDGAIDQAVDIADHLRKALQPGFVGNADRLVKAATDVRRSSGQPYSVEDELVALVGWRATTTDPKTALYYRSFEFTDAATEARKTITDTLRDANTVTPEDIADAKLRAKAKQEQAFKEMSRLVGAAEAAGMSKMQIVQTLRLSNISQSNIAALMQGRTPEVTVTPQVAAQAIRQAMTMRGKEFASEVADRYRTAMKN